MSQKESRRESDPAAIQRKSNANTSTPSAYARLGDALRDNGYTVNDTGTHAEAQCPAHDDRKPSLALTEAPGKVLVYCHAGCDTNDVLAALNLTQADLFDTPGGISYLYAGGRKVTRTPNKSFRQSGNMRDRSLFQVEDIGDADTLYVTEGEQDAVTLATLCKVAAVSPAQGAKTPPNKWDWTPLTGRQVTVIADKDAAGRRHAEAVKAHLQPIARSVKIMEAAIGKDISDHLAAGKTLDELVPVSLLDDLSFSSEWLEQQQFPDLEHIVPGVLVEGVTVLAGPPKVGKSFLVTNIALAVVSGGKALGYIDVSPRPVLVLALEDGKRRLQSRYRDISRGPIPPGITFVTKATPAECLSVMAEYLQRYGHLKPLIILDTLGKVKPQKGSGQEAYLVDYEIGGKFKALAEAYPGSAILVIHHTRKADAADFVDLVSGTQGIAGSVDAIVTLARKRGETDAVLSVTGRDVAEGEYALTVDDGMAWRLDGGNLIAAANRLDARREEADQERRARKLGPDMRKVLELVNERGRVTAEQITFKLQLTPKRLSTITDRLVSGDFI
ncbi:AAA family ATPase, partial [Mycobacterium intracellulare]|uniref:AAA family ATPase n=1 Tax=Mycobacterium intracellulare TaxID=1767 RepID=UPI0035587A83